MVSLRADKTHKGLRVCSHMHGYRQKLVGDVGENCCTLVHERLNGRHSFRKRLSAWLGEHG